MDNHLLKKMQLHKPSSYFDDLNFSMTSFFFKNIVDIDSEHLSFTAIFSAKIPVWL